jgi:pimeloyl-ACP methyl ester carboxylesterase
MNLTANGIDINYEIEGEGPVVTFSHSLACSLAMWDEQVAALRGRYRVLRYDTRGHGRRRASTLSSSSPTTSTASSAGSASRRRTTWVCRWGG